LALDYGQKRVGIAVTDPMKIIASGLQTVPTHNIWHFLEEYMKKEDVEKVVIGYPRDLKNEPSGAVKFIDPFIKAYKKKYPGTPIITHDERFTSKMAFQAMIDGGIKKKARQDKALVDKISAAILLDSYLFMLKNMNKK